MKIIRETNFTLICNFLENNFSSPTHWPDWNLVVSKFYNTNFFYYTAYEKGNLIGICPIHEDGNEFLKTLHSGQFHFISNGGWIFNRDTIVEKRFYPLKSTQMFQGFSLPIIENFKASYNLKHHKKFWTLLIDLNNDLEYIWKTEINSKRRNMIRKAEKNNIIIEFNNDKTEDFYKIYKQSCLRLTLSILPLEYFSQLFNKNNNIHFDIISAKKEEEYLANIVIAYDKNYAIYWLSNNADNIPNFGQGELLQWEAIKRMKEKGCHYYDLSYIIEEDSPNVCKFKKGFSKNEVPIVWYSKKRFIFKVIKKIQKVLK